MKDQALEDGRRPWGTGRVSSRSFCRPPGCYDSRSPVEYRRVRGSPEWPLRAPHRPPLLAFVPWPKTAVAGRGRSGACGGPCSWAAC